MKAETRAALDRFLNRYIAFICRHPVKVLLFALLSASLSVHFASRLQLKTDFVELLPEGYRSVDDIHRLTERVGGIGNLTVVIETEDLAAAQRYADDLAGRLRSDLPEGYVRYIEYRVDDEKRFYENHKYLYADLEDLEEIQSRLSRQILKTKLEQNPLFVSEEDLGLETEDEPFTVSDLEEKYEKQASEQLDKWVDGYFTGHDEQGQFLVMVLKPFGSSTGVSFSRDLCERVLAIAEGLEPTSYHPSLKVGLTGKYRLILDQYESVNREIFTSAGVTLSLVALAIFLYFRTIVPVINITLVVVVGILWTFCLTYFRIGYLNMQTAFLGAIIIGNGINYGLILMSRYKEERLRGENARDGVQIAFRNTLTATVTSAASTGLAYGTLMITDFRGFNHFGFIGGLGMLLCWLSTFSLLPALLMLWDRTAFGRNTWTRKVSRGRSMSRLANLVQKAPRTVVGTSASLVLLSAALLVWWLPNSFEYDFSKLRNEPRGDTYERILNHRVNALFGISQSPAVILADRLDQVPGIRRAVLDKKEAEKEVPNPTIDRVRTVFDLLPEDQEDKIDVLWDIEYMLDTNPPDELGIPSDQLAKINDFRDNLSLDGITVDDLPEALTRPYEERDGTVGRLVYVYPRSDAGLWNGRNLIRFAEVVRSNQLPDDEVIYSSGEAVVFADMLKAVDRDGPIATIACFVGVITLLVLAFRSIHASVVILASLLGGMLVMGGVIAVFDIKVNFFNFIVIPTTLGIGVDYSVNLYQRYRLDGRGSIRNMVQHTGAALVMCSSTTLIGYTSLMLTSNRGLHSFGIMANVGEIATLATALVALPAYLLIMEKRRTRPVT
ncbi:MAG: MMPL family transporter [Gemmatimonadetes bacterium]|nr:MMPL family transporter [Gemmatimonadota bacterium]